MLQAPTLTAPTTVSLRVGNTGKARFYQPKLDAVRFFAFLAVFLFHFSHPVDFYVEHGVPRFVAQAANDLMGAGVLGVDLFFVLSAYLITELLLREKRKTGTLDVPSFYLRRTLRIWPLYFFYIGLAIIPALNPNHVSRPIWGEETEDGRTQERNPVPESGQSQALTMLCHLGLIAFCFPFLRWP